MPHKDLQAAAVVGGTAATLGYMYLAGSQTKKEAGPASIYSMFPSALLLSEQVVEQRPRWCVESTEESGGLNSSVSDARMTSKDVREAVQGEKKP